MLSPVIPRLIAKSKKAFWRESGNTMNESEHAFDVLK